MISRHWLTLLRIGTLLALLTSAALLLHYVDPESTTSFCGGGSGCEAVRKQAPKVLGLPHFVPLVGVIGFLLLLWASFLSNPRRAVLIPAVLGGIVGVLLLTYQALAIGEFCWMCVVVDVLAIAVAASAVALAKTKAEQSDPLRGWAWGALFALAINTPTVWDQVEPDDELPPAIANLQQAGKLTVIEFVDAQCPHCRRFNPVLEAELQRLTTPVNFQRVHVPLAFHPLAEDAARAAICARTLGKGDEMEERLLTLPLTEDVWFAHARALGLDDSVFRNCLPAESTTRTLAEHRALFDATGSHSLPLTLIGNQQLEGAGDAVLVHRTIQKALETRTTLPAWLFVVILAALVTIVVWFGKKRKAAG